MPTEATIQKRRAGYGPKRNRPWFNPRAKEVFRAYQRAQQAPPTRKDS